MSSGLVALDDEPKMLVTTTPLSGKWPAIKHHAAGTDVELPAHGVLRLDNLPVGGPGYTWPFLADTGVLVTYLPDTNYNTVLVVDNDSFGEANVV